MSVEDLLRSVPEGKILVEYEPMKHPERIFHTMIKFYLNSGDVPLVVDVIDSLHVFVQHLAFQGVNLPLDKILVIKCGGRVNLGNVIGRISVTDNFEYYLAQHARIARKFMKTVEKGRQVTFFLGTGKFIMTFQDDPYKLENYFETIFRGYDTKGDKVSIFFVNRGVVNEHALKSLEQDSNYVIQVDRETRLLKAPGRVGNEAL
ncbi:DUF257 family protein [Thermococcus sp.]|uniref:DUF257 family protein n=1 Tax=Thermococcus sp. TaxID=35749 RepID=UPI00262C60E3|nr:DUF257 family protein [Thermococcus sp.]